MFIKFKFFRFRMMSIVSFAAILFAQTTAAATLAIPLGQFKYASGNAGSGKIIKVANMPFKAAWQLKIERATINAYNTNLLAVNKYEIALGDKGTIAFYARSLGKNNAVITVMLESRAPRWIKLTFKKINISKQWKRYVVMFKAKKTFANRNIKSYAPGDTIFKFCLGHQAQSLEIGGISYENYGADADFSKVNFYRPSYKGMEANARWRVAALKRIEKLRKGNFSIKVIDQNGKAVPNAGIKLKLARHKFVFGSCLSKWKFKGKNGQRYRKEFKKLFNTAVMEAGMKWKYGTVRSSDMLPVVKWCKENNIRLRGHALIWPSWKYSPKYLKKLKDDKAALREVIRDHIYYAASVSRKDTFEWDVVNEAFSNHDIMDILGNDIMVDWYKTAKLASPNNQMYINDYGILTRADNLNNPRLIWYKNTIRYLLEKGAPLEGIGMQSHFNGGATDPENMLKAFDSFAEFNIPIKITEYDLCSDDESFEAAFMRDILIATFSHKSVNGFITWGFWDGAHWRNDAPIFRKDWSLKPSGKVYKELVHGQWQTNLQGSSDHDGIYTGRGFYGDYIVTITTAGKKIIRRLNFDKSKSQYTIFTGSK